MQQLQKHEDVAAAEFTCKSIMTFFLELLWMKMKRFTLFCMFTRVHVLERRVVCRLLLLTCFLHCLAVMELREHAKLPEPFYSV